jgi:integral membrane protein (TIGR00529 family)
MFHPLLNLLLTFGLIVLLLRKKVTLGWVMMAGALALGLLFQVSIAEQLQAVRRAIISPVFLQLGVALNIIMFLEHILRTKGYLNRTLDALRILVPNSKINIAILPAFLGLLPSPGGVIFSAPLVAEIGSDLTMTAEDKGLINYWFRHVWEYFLPFYPGIILASQILSVPLGTVSLTLAAFFLISITAGFWLIIGRIPAPTALPVLAPRSDKSRALRQLLGGVWPVLLTVLVILIFHWDVGLTVAGVIAVLLLLNRYRRADLQILWKEAFAVSIVYLIAGVLIFKEMLQASGVVEWLPQYLRGLGIPDLFIIICLTFAVGFAVGMTQGYVAATFPLLVGIIGSGASLKPGLLILAYVSGYAGVLLSPTHFCFALSINYFKADLLTFWRRLLWPVGLILGSAILFAWFWK